MHVDLHVLQPDQDDIQHGAKSDDPPDDSRQADMDIGEPHPAGLNEMIELPSSFGIEDFLALLCGLEGRQNVKERSDALRPAGWGDALALLRPAVLDRVSGIFAQAVLQLAAHRLRKTGKIPVKRGDARRLLIDRISYVRVVLIGCDSDEAEQEPEKHKETR